MSILENSSARPSGVHTPARPAPRHALLAIVLTTLGIIALIWTEIWLSTAAGVWAVVQLLGLGQTGYYALAAMLVPAAAWASWHTARLAWIGERYGTGE